MKGGDGGRWRISPPAAILLALFPVIALGLLNGLYKECVIRGEPALFWLQDTLTFVIFPLAGALLLARVAGLVPARYGLPLRDPHWSASDLAAHTVIVTIGFGLCYQLGLDAGLALWPAAATQSSFETLMPTASLPRMMLVLYLSATAALVEESAFRALPWTYVRMRVSPRWCVPVYLFASALLFAFIHSEQGPHAVLATFLLGLFAAALYTRIENLWPFVGAHFVLDVWSFW